MKKHTLRPLLAPPWITDMNVRGFPGWRNCGTLALRNGQLPQVIQIVDKIQLELLPFECSEVSSNVVGQAQGWGSEHISANSQALPNCP